MLLRAGSRAFNTKGGSGLAPLDAVIGRSIIHSSPGLSATVQLMLEHGDSQTAAGAKENESWASQGSNAKYDKNGNLVSDVKLNLLACQSID